MYDNKSLVRKVTLTTEPYIDSKTELVYARSFDSHGSQFNISLSYLPPGVVLTQIKQGQSWWIEKRTNSWNLMSYVGEFNPYSYALFNSTKTWSPSALALSTSTIIYDTIVSFSSSSSGSILSDPTSGSINVPIPGIYDIFASAGLSSGYKSSTSGRLALYINYMNGFNKISQSGPWSSPGTGTSISDANPIANISNTIVLKEQNLNFTISAAWSGSGLVNIDNANTTNTYLTVAYRGPISQ